MLIDQSLTKTFEDGFLLAKLDYTPDRYVISSDTSQNPPWTPFNLETIIATDSESSNCLAVQPNPTESNLAFICFSSGTTGPMKGVYLTHENIVSNIFPHRQRLPEMFQSHKTVAALVTPFYHILGLGVFVCQYICQVRVVDPSIFGRAG